MSTVSVFRVLALCLSIATGVLPGGNVRLLPALPKGAVSTAIQLDAAGNTYLAGYFAAASPTDSSDAFVAKLSADGQTLVYFVPIAGTQPDSVRALALGPDNSVYLAGATQSRDFPVTAGALEQQYSYAGVSQGFLVKVDPSGSVVYSSYINGPAGAELTGIALGRAGEVFLTGVGGPEYQLGATQPPKGFVLKLDAALSKVQLSEYGYGGGLIRLDNEENMYLAGSAMPDVTNNSSGFVLTLPPLSAPAFQTTHDARFCRVLAGLGGSHPCRYQYVAKLDAAGNALWATYITGTYGAISRGLAVDGEGNVIVAGVTYSDDYPVTAGAFQTSYSAAAPPFPTPVGSPFQEPPPAAGFVTKLNSKGTALVWSTYFGGSFSDQITAMAVAPEGDIVVSGRAASNDLPALAGTAEGCRPFPSQPLGFVARISGDGASAGGTLLIANAPDCSYLTCSTLADFPAYAASWPLALRPDGTALTAGTNGTVAAIDFAASSRVQCVADPADNVQLRTVAPGQFLSVFGADLAPAKPFVPPGGVAESTADLGVYFNGIPAPVLYASANQVNVQVPFEIAGQTNVEVQVVNKQVPLPLSETRTLGVMDRQPAVFLSPAAWESAFPWYTECGVAVALGPAALAINADGTVNSCDNPAAFGSVVTLFVNGLGQVSPAQETGAIAQAPAVPLSPGVDLLDPSLSPITTTTTAAPGSLMGVTRVQFRVPAASSGLTSVAITPRVLGNNMRERLVLIWTRPN